ncbi:MAG: hypothetical protein HC921_06795 [Synechococcaceae cyanobacterium SM2_3_1]|nr:hypothetical protein [Synechococcaceae cyanobacterium SM2_3_1]
MAITYSQTQLALTRSEPAEGERGVNIEKVLQLQFNQQLPPDLEELNVTVEPETDLIFDTREDRLLIKSQEPWDYSTDYIVQVPQQTSLNLEQGVRLQFRTEPEYTYNRDIQPLLDASCVGCHRPEGRQRNQLLDSYGAVLQYVTPADPDSVLIDPQWTKRHGNIEQARLEPGQENQPNPVSPPIPGGGAGVGGVRLPGGGTGDPGGGTGAVPGSGASGGGGSPELAYVREKGYPIARLGRWTSEEVEIVRTWIVQDEAAEDLDS